MRFYFSIAVLPLAACSPPFEGRIAERLAAAGLSRSMSQCMAERWVKRLNVLQLREIASTADDLKAEGDRLTVGRLIARIREIDDPEIVEVVTRSIMVCGLSA